MAMSTCVQRQLLFCRPLWTTTAAATINRHRNQSAERFLLLSPRMVRGSWRVRVLFLSTCGVVAAATCRMDAYTSTEPTRRNQPPRFGRSVRKRLHSTQHDDTTNENDDSVSVSVRTAETSSSSSLPQERSDRAHCPLCQKYGRGPCGELFVKWLDCTDAHPGVNPKTNTEYHVEHCQHLGEPLAVCLQTHESYYAGIIAVDEETDDEANVDTESHSEEDEDDSTKDAWERLIQQVESSKPKGSFPASILPQAEIRPRGGTGMVAFCYEHSGRPLVLAYVKDDVTGAVVAAGSHSDLWEWKNNRGILRLGMPPKATSLTMYALYEAESESNEVIFASSFKVPTNEES